MYKQCRTEQSAARQRELIKGLLEAMNQQHYDEITVSSLCEQMQIPRKSFYRYFSSKEGALHALIDHALMDFESYTGKSAITGRITAQQELERIFGYWLHQKRLLDALAKSNLSGVLVNRAIVHSFEEYLPDQKYLPVEEQFARQYMTLYQVSGLMSMVIQWHRDGYPQTAGQMAQIAIRLVGQTLAPKAFEK